MEWRELEQHIDRELRALPPPAAPDTLLPRVMAAVAGSQRAPWYSRAWLNWPLEAQLASVLVLTACGLGAWWAAPAIAAWSEALAPLAAPLAAWVSGAADWAARALAVGRAAWLVVLEPVLYLLTGLAVLATLAGAACWAAATRLALGGASLR